MKQALIFMIKLYQWGLSTWLGRQCRFEPTCSHYAIAALQKYGIYRGLRLTICRISRCHPWQPGGYDPLP